MGGGTVTSSLRATAWYRAKIVTNIDAETLDVSIVKCAVVAPVAMVTDEGTFRTSALLLSSATTTPLAPAAAVRRTVPLTWDCPGKNNDPTDSADSSAGTGGGVGVGAVGVDDELPDQPITPRPMMTTIYYASRRRTPRGPNKAHVSLVCWWKPRPAGLPPAYVTETKEQSPKA